MGKNLRCVWNIYVSFTRTYKNWPCVRNIYVLFVYKKPWMGKISPCVWNRHVPLFIKSTGTVVNVPDINTTFPPSVEVIKNWPCVRNTYVLFVYKKPWMGKIFHCVWNIYVFFIYKKPWMGKNLPCVWNRHFLHPWRSLKTDLVSGTFMYSLFIRSHGWEKFYLVSGTLMYSLFIRSHEWENFHLVSGDRTIFKLTIRTDYDPAFM